MQMKALRSANFAKLSSSSSTSDEYWDGSTSAGTPAGYCLSQIRSMVSPLRSIPPFGGTGDLFWAVLSKRGADGKRPRCIGILSPRRGAGAERTGWPRYPAGLVSPPLLLLVFLGLAGFAAVLGFADFVS